MLSGDRNCRACDLLGTAQLWGGAGLSARGISSVLPPWDSRSYSSGSASQEQAHCVLQLWASLCCCEAQGADKLGGVAGRSLGDAGCRAQAGGGGTGCLTLAELELVLK